MKRVKDKTLLQDKDVVSYYHLHKFDKQYDEIIKTAYEENPLPEVTTKKRGRKKKTKVSGCFRSEEGAQEYLTIMSYIGTAHQHGINAFTAIRKALLGNSDIIFN